MNKPLTKEQVIAIKEFTADRDEFVWSKNKILDFIPYLLSSPHLLDKLGLQVKDENSYYGILRNVRNSTFYITPDGKTLFAENYELYKYLNLVEVKNPLDKYPLPVLYDAVDRAYTNVEPQPNWIKIEEGCEMPEEDDEVLILIKGYVSKISIAKFKKSGYSKGVFYERRDAFDCYPTHWQPLPPKP